MTGKLFDFLLDLLGSEVSDYVKRKRLLHKILKMLFGIMVVSLLIALALPALMKARSM